VLAAVSAIFVTAKNRLYWTVMDRGSLAKAESCSSARRCARGGPPCRLTGGSMSAIA
jgi:hypothetical protein